MAAVLPRPLVGNSPLWVESPPAGGACIHAAVLQPLRRSAQPVAGALRRVGRVASTAAPAVRVWTSPAPLRPAGLVRASGGRARLVRAPPTQTRGGPSHGVPLRSLLAPVARGVYKPAAQRAALRKREARLRVQGEGLVETSLLHHMSPPQAGQRPLPPPAGGVVSGERQVKEAVARRVYGGVWPRPKFAAHADARLFKQLCQVHELLRLLPPAAVELGVLGAGAATQVPDASERLELIADAVAKAAGPEGGTAAKGRRSWDLLQAYARKHGLPNAGLPASKAAVAQIVRREGLRARAAGRGSQGGSTVAKTIADGFVFLQTGIGLAIEAACPLVQAVTEVRQTALPRAPKHAASMPLCIQLQLETLAAAMQWSVARVLARCFLTGCFAHHTRLNDTLNAVLQADGEDPAGVIFGATTTRSKDGLPLFLYAPAEGWLGPWDWYPAHLAEMAGRAHAVPDYVSRPARCPQRASGLAEGVMPRDKALPTLQGLCAMAPLCMSQSEFRALNITTHSPHGTGPDMVRFMGTEGGFSEGDARAAGHWLRDRHAHQDAPQPGQRAVPTGARNARHEMERRYTQGAGRRGERAEQLRVRVRLVAAVREALQRFGAEWTLLPRNLASWDILLHGQEAA